MRRAADLIPLPTGAADRAFVVDRRHSRMATPAEARSNVPIGRPVWVRPAASKTRKPSG
jgi:hypothetical protein